MGKYDKLEELYSKVASHPIFLHPDQRRDYTDKELSYFDGNLRDFETRLFITATQVAGDTVFLGTHHTDNAKHMSHFNYVRDYLKATHSTKNWTCAKATLTTLLTMCFQLNQSDYCTFAISMASGLSRSAGNTKFELNDMMVRDKEEEKTVRLKFCLLMDVIFSKMATKKFLLDDKSCNIFRLVYCDTHHQKRKGSLFVAFFSFTLQICLTAYVILQNIATPTHDYDNMRMLPLAIFTFAYSFMVAIPTVTETNQAYTTLFRGIGLLQMMDFIVNIMIPLLLAVSGFLVILCQSNFIDAVLNVTALLFIPEIDDQLPDILGMQENDIIRNFLIAQSMKDFDEILKMQDEEYNSFTLAKRNVVCRVQFGDFYLTNLVEQGIDAQHGEAFQPYQVTVSDGDNGHQIDPSTFVTASCLLKKIEWHYTTGFPKTTNRRIGKLKLTKINGKVVEIERKKDPAGKIGINEKVHELSGVFVITTFQMSEDVIKLRVCGSLEPEHFIDAFEYYSLWDMTDSAKDKVNKLVKQQYITEDSDELSVETDKSISRSIRQIPEDDDFSAALLEKPSVESPSNKSNGNGNSKKGKGMSNKGKSRRNLKRQKSSRKKKKS